MKTLKRVGIYSGTFDPVHAGHIAFALQAQAAGKLDEVYFLPERRPRHKKTVEHFGHRVAMLNQAAKPHPKFKVLELPDVEFSVSRTLPRLRKIIGDKQLVYMIGSDIVPHISEWPYVERLFEQCELVIGVRSDRNAGEVKKLIEAWPVKPAVITMFESYAPDVSSTKIRQALRTRQVTGGVLSSVYRYSNKNWLYVSLS